jgi:molybdopterin-containing oxidoreductase family membrane subunit
MIERVLTGSKKYLAWQGFLTLLVLMGIYAYSQQYVNGLGATGMSRDISWGVYIAQFTFLVGVAASAVMLVLPYYMHNYKAFGRIVVLGEFLAIAAVSMCLLFILADMGKPMRGVNVLLYPTPNSVLFWDMIVLNVYLFLNLLCGMVAMESERKDMPPPKWIKPFIWVSIPWAVSIHTVTAFLYAGLPGRHFWLTAIMAPRFLASAFAGGPALLIILALILKKVTKFDAGETAIKKLATITTYAAVINVFFVLLEFFTAYYSNVPGHSHTLDYLFFGLHGYDKLVPWMWTSAAFNIGAILLLLTPSTREKMGRLAFACTILFVGLWIDKGIGLVIGGFIPNPLEQIREYTPTAVEIMVTIGIWAIGFQILTTLYKMAVSIKEEKEAA